MRQAAAAPVLGRRRLFVAQVMGCMWRASVLSVMCGQEPSAAARCMQALSHRHAAHVWMNLIVQKLYATSLTRAF